MEMDLYQHPNANSSVSSITSDELRWLASSDLFLQEASPIEKTKTSPINIPPRTPASPPPSIGINDSLTLLRTKGRIPRRRHHYQASTKSSYAKVIPSALLPGVDDRKPLDDRKPTHVQPSLRCIITPGSPLPTPPPSASASSSSTTPTSPHTPNGKKMHSSSPIRARGPKSSPSASTHRNQEWIYRRPKTPPASASPYANDVSTHSTPHSTGTSQSTFQSTLQSTLQAHSIKSITSGPSSPRALSSHPRRATVSSGTSHRRPGTGYFSNSNSSSSPTSPQSPLRSGLLDRARPTSPPGSFPSWFSHTVSNNMHNFKHKHSRSRSEGEGRSVTAIGASAMASAATSKVSKVSKVSKGMGRGNIVKKEKERELPFLFTQTFNLAGSSSTAKEMEKGEKAEVRSGGSSGDLVASSSSSSLVPSSAAPAPAPALQTQLHHQPKTTSSPTTSAPTSAFTSSATSSAAPRPPPSKLPLPSARPSLMSTRSPSSTSTSTTMSTSSSAAMTTTSTTSATSSSRPQTPVSPLSPLSPYRLYSQHQLHMQGGANKKHQPHHRDWTFDASNSNINILNTSSTGSLGRISSSPSKSILTQRPLEVIVANDSESTINDVQNTGSQFSLASSTKKREPGARKDSVGTQCTTGTTGSGPKSVKFVEMPTVHYASVGYWDCEEPECEFPEGDGECAGHGENPKNPPRTSGNNASRFGFGFGSGEGGEKGDRGVESEMMGIDVECMDVAIARGLEGAEGDEEEVEDDDDDLEDVKVPGPPLRDEGRARHVFRGDVNVEVDMEVDVFGAGSTVDSYLPVTPDTRETSVTPTPEKEKEKGTVLKKRLTLNLKRKPTSTPPSSRRPGTAPSPTSPSRIPRPRISGPFALGSQPPPPPAVPPFPAAAISAPVSSKSRPPGGGVSLRTVPSLESFRSVKSSGAKSSRSIRSLRSLPGSIKSNVSVGARGLRDWFKDRIVGHNVGVGIGVIG